MLREINVAVVSLGLALGAAGCGNFLTGDKLTNDPNNPSQATPEQLFVGVQANMFSSQENSVAMTVCMWMQQCMGVGGRFVDRKSTRLNSSHSQISYAVFCLKKKKS